MTITPETPGLHAHMTPCHWGSVNQWECDENDHLNVRFYAQKTNQALQIMVSHMSDTKPSDVLPSIRRQHIRFLAESRAATPLRVDCGVLRRGDHDAELLSLVHDNVTGKVLSSFRTTLDTTGWHFAADADKRVETPAVAQPRGLDPSSLPTPPAGWDAARRAGYRIVGRGVVGPELCDAAGRLLPHGYIGLVSDGMPNLWAFLNPPGEQEARSAGELGGAALEQHLDILAPLEAGSVFVQLSGVRALGNKTQQMAHLLFDESRRRVAAAVEAVGVAMDLTTRRAVVISPERRRHLESLLLR